jgi:hypothetical protein
MKLTSNSKSELNATPGKVRIQFQRVESGKPVTGEQSTSFTVDETTVHEAKDTFLQALEAIVAKAEKEAAKAEKSAEATA